MNTDISRNQYYEERVNRVLDYVGEHLDEDLSLARLASIGCFSPFHFHRIFQGVTGETLNAHVRRVRLERAAMLMKASPRRLITDVALATGFAGTAEFSRAFKGHFGKTASSWDRRSPLENSKICKAPEGMPFHTVEELEIWKATAARVQVVRYAAFRFVYFRIYAAHGNMSLVDRHQALAEWLAARGTNAREVKFIGMSQDDPSITPAENCRYDMGVAFALDSRMAAAPTAAECERTGLTLRDFPAQEMVSVHCVGDIEHVGRAWQYLYRVWLPKGEYEPVDLPAMEMFVKLPEEIGWETFDLHACIPVARL